MAEEIPRQTFQLKDLPTKSVTLYPARAHVIREIRDVQLRSGQNEIEIHGLTADADPNSVQIDGKGAATITDLTLELVPNTEHFSDVYPSESESSDDEDDEYEDSDDEIQEVKQLRSQIKSLELKIEAATEEQKSAERRLKTLDAHANGITSGTAHVKWTAGEVSDALGMYDEVRQKLFKTNIEAGVRLKEYKKAKARLVAEAKKAGKEEQKRKSKEQKEKSKQKEKRLRERADKRREVERVRDEKRKFWATNHYKVTLGLEAAFDTPSSSRRGSVDSVTLSGVPAADGKQKALVAGSGERLVTLLISYVTNSAFWTPRYDLTINSQQKTATIVYRAEFSNGTSETWKDAKVILSTSQTSYSGLEDKAPYMASWAIKLGRAWENNAGGLLSSAELKGPRYQNAISQQASKNNYLSKTKGGGGLFGNTSTTNNNFSSFGSVQQQSAFGSAVPPPPQQAALPPPGSLFGSSNANNNNNNNEELVQLQPRSTPLAASARPFAASAKPAANSNSLTFGGFGSSSSSTADKESKKRSTRLGSGFFGGGGNSNRREEEDSPAEEACGKPTAGAPDDDEPFAEDNGENISFEESVWEDNGLTANYELPGIRTLVPSSVARRHKIASLSATNVHLSYVCVPKLRSAAFLRAKVRNPSATVTLLKGTAGVTLDGSFLGNMTLPRVSPSQLFSLPLGIDPGIQLSYPKPNVHRSTSGIFTKEAAHTFNRSIWLTNTKPSAVELLVLDQVPVSQDERLRIDIVQPRGLTNEGDSVRAGQAAKEGGKEVAAVGSVKEGAWGKATAALKKNGEINWTVNLEKGAACLLKLEYEARMPNGESIVEV